MFNKDTFLSVVLPDSGSYCVVGLKKDEKPKQKFVGSIEEIGVLADALVSQGYDAYFALASFGDPKEGRTADNATHLKAFFIDIDCGIGKPYADQQEGLLALKQFCLVTKLPKPTIVNSGRGVHAYWMLEETLPAFVWKPLAEKFKALCQKHGLEADPAVTADLARILRIPETLNFKNPDDPQVVSIVSLAETISISVIQDVLNTVEDDIFAGMQGKPYVPRQLDALTLQLMGNSQSRFKTIILKSASGEGCAQLLNIYENQSTIEEPLWRGGLSIAHACVDRDVAIHNISKKHPNYSAAETEKKANETKGPYTCATFRKLNPQLCHGCKHDISSPIQLGKEIAEASEEDNVVEETVAGKEEPVQFVIPKYPFPYFRGKVGGVYVRTKGDDDEEDEILIYPYDFYILKRMHDPDLGETVLARLHLPKDGVREFLMPLTAVVSKERFVSTVASHGVTVLGKKQDLLMSYVTKWVEELQASTEAEKARRQFGWLDDNSAFILGDKEIKANEIKYSPPTASTLPLVPMFQEKGDFHIWKDVVNAYGRQNMEAKAFALFMGFGNVLLRFTNLEGYLLSLKSQGTGSGKTTILHAVASIYGRPKEPLLQVKDTYNQKMQRIGTFQNIPVLMDEMTNMEPEQKSNLAYDITQGRAKNRLKSQENAERLNITRWATGLITTSNRSIRDDLLSIKSFPEGELARIMELHIFNDPNDDPQWARQHFNRLYDNYGHAIFPYMQYVVGHLPEIIAFIEQMQTKIETAANIKSHERYWSAMATIAIVGGIISRRLGLHDIDHRPVMNYIVKHIVDSRALNKQMLAENSDFLGSFLQRHFHEILVINGIKDGKTGLETGPIREPRGALTARYEPDTKMLYVVAKSFRDECNKGQLNYEEATQMYVKSGALTGTKKKRMAAGTVANTQAGVTALCFDTTKLDFFREERLLNAKDSESDDSDTLGKA